MAQIALNYSAAQINAAIAKITTLVSVIEGSIVQLYDGTTAIYPRTKAEAVFFNNDTSKTLDQQFSQLEQEQIQGGVYDVSAHNDSAVFESLQALLSSSNLSTFIPTSVRHGGMSIRFIQGSVPNSDNKYVQYRYMETVITTSTFINVANWQGVDDEPIAGSDNLITSGGVYNSTHSIPTVANSFTKSDLNISDEQENVLVMFQNGHIKTKNFDSSKDATTEERGLMSAVDKTKLNSIEEGAQVNDIITDDVSIFEDVDFNISDEEGNILMQLKNGHIKTKNFDSSKRNYLPRPSNGIINFFVNVDCYIADNNSNTLNNQDIPQNEQSTYIKQDWGILMLPENYKQEGEAVYLVVCCHGTGTWISSDATQVNGRTDDMLLGMGFAIMDMNGCPDATSTSDRGYGTPPSLRAYLAGIHYVVQNYNIRKEIFVCGASMGGLASTFIAEVYPNVIAQGAFCPCLDIVREAYMTPWNGTTQKDRICTKFGFIGEKPTFSEGRPISQEEKTYLISNIDKIIGYNNMWRNTIGLNFENCITVDAPSIVTSETSDEIALFNNAIKIRKTPFKIWHNINDPLVPFKYSKYFVEMCRRGGCLVELRSFPSGGHNAWQNGEKINVTTKYKGTLEVYTSEYELLLWFLRFINN